MPIKKSVWSRHGRIVVSFWLGRPMAGWRYGGLVEGGLVVTAQQPGKWNNGRADGRALPRKIVKNRN